MGIILMIFIIPYLIIWVSSIRIFIKEINSKKYFIIFLGFLLSVVWIMLVHLDPILNREVYFFSFIPSYIIFLWLIPLFFSNIKYRSIWSIISIWIAFCFLYAILTIFLWNPLLLWVKELH